jgi:hypothetical protein
LSGTVTLTADFNCSDYAAEIVVAGNVTVLGNGAVCDARLRGRFFNLASGTSALTLDSITLRHGSAYTGGAINNENGGTLTIGNSNFTSNVASDSKYGNGGAIYNNRGGVLNINSSVFQSNSADGQYGGAINNGNGGTLTIGNSNFTSNAAVGFAGAIYNIPDMYSNGGHLNITSTVFQNNYVQGGFGGAIYNNRGHLNISSAVFQNNSVQGANNVNGGGAVYNTGIFTVGNSNFTSNEAAQGGGIFNAATLTVLCGTVFSNNKALNTGGGGGLFISGPTEIHMPQMLDNFPDNVAGAVPSYYCDQPGTILKLVSCPDCVQCPAGQYFEIQDSSNCKVTTMFVPPPTACTLCPAGKYQDKPGQLNCTDCPRDFFGSTQGSNSSNCSGPCPASTFCPGGCSSATPLLPGVVYTLQNGTACKFEGKPCPLGSSCLDGAQTFCPVGQYASNQGSFFCPACPPGRFQGSRGQASCEACPATKFQGSAEQSNCSACEKGQFQNDVGRPNCQATRAEYYARRVNSSYTEEISCPKASAERNSADSGPFSCINGILEFRDNFWHDGLKNETEAGVVWQQQLCAIVNSTTDFYACECNNNNTCCNVNSSSGSVSCAFGSHGLLCSQCIDAYFKEPSTGNCVQCGTWAATETPLIAVLALPVFVLVFFIWWKLAGKIPGCRGTKAWVSRGACCPLFIRKYNFGRPINLFVTSYKQNVKTKIKLLVGFYQVSTLLQSAYNVPYPYTYLHVLAKLQFISVDVTKALPGPCIFGPGYNFERKLYTMGALAFVICAGSRVLIKFSSGEHQKSWAKKALPGLPTVLFLAYPGFSAFIFVALNCRHIDGAEYLVADLSVRCSGPDYSLLQATAIVCVVFWCFGLPAMVMSLLWPERRKLLQGRRPGGLAGRLHKVYAPFKPEYWFFESLEFGKKLLLVGIVPAVSGDRASDLVGAVTALLISAVHLSLILALSPYTYKSDQFLAVCLGALLSVVILISVLLKMNAGYIAHQAAVGFDPETASKLLVASSLLVVVLSVVAYAISARQVGQNDSTRHGHNSSLQMPLLQSVPGAQSPSSEEDAEAVGVRELPMTADSPPSSSSS